MPTTVLIVDDHEAFRTNARALLEAEGYRVVGEAENGVAALRLAKELNPDVVLLDVQLPDFDGFEVARRLGEFGNPPAVILTSSRDDYSSLVASTTALGFIPKDQLSGRTIETLLT